MKLITKINLRYLIFTFITMLFLGVGLHFFMKMLIDEEIDEKLEHTSEAISNKIAKENKLHNLKPYIVSSRINAQKDSKSYTDTTIYDEDNGNEDYRQLCVIRNINGETYQIIVREAELESEDLLQAISILILTSLFVLFFTLFIVNQTVFKNIWSSFYSNLEKLKHFSLSDLKPYVPVQTDILEFNELNTVVRSLTQRVINDYDILKRFSEDASHELQTPLAVMRSKIESLLDGNELNPVQAEKIQSIYSSVNKLTRINKDLLLLAKIENNQFKDNPESLSFKNLIHEKIDYFNELMEIKNLHFSFSTPTDWRIVANKNLVDILLNNLFNNAIKHTVHEGIFRINLSNNAVTFFNTGVNKLKGDEKLFNRFYKESNADSVGLGLAISKQICNSLNLQISYTFESDLHHFTLTSKL